VKYPARTATVVFAGGGTGGHFFPAVAIADRLTEMLSDHAGSHIVFVGTKRGIEYRLKDTLAYPLHVVNIRGIQRSLRPANLLVPFLIVSSLINARSLLKRLRPDIVVGTGGYVSWPVVTAANSQGITTVIQEQNSFPGITTRRLASKATRVYLGFAEAKQFLPQDIPCLLTGNPVRRAISGGDREAARKHFGLDPNKITILVLGGSQGATQVNDAIMRGLLDGSLSDKYQLLWQTGKRDYTDVVSATGEKSRNHTLFPFENNMALVYAAADIAIARAGAITLAELEACLVPAVLVPYPQAARDHQRKNASAHAAKGYARVIDPGDLGHTNILALTADLCESEWTQKARAAMAQDLAGRKPAVDVIAEDIIKLITSSQEATFGS
jgi:UDP-N-acetylglucosamine--N-acetylmuramyl-(pentapeptide) pyrophosphoryl-undecaprenol N-acetylglucosamine transferase